MVKKSVASSRKTSPKEVMEKKYGLKPSRPSRGKAKPRTKDGTYGAKGEAPGQRRTVARRAKVQRMRNSKNATALNKNIRRQQRPRPY